MTPDLLAKYDGLRVPRYTSYPTAPNFTAAVGPDTYLDWLSRLDPATGLSIYLHVPFCDSMCWYCGCNTRVVARYQPVAAYIELLGREIDLITAVLPKGMTVHHLHWGGGTPNMVAPADFEGIMGRINRHFVLAPTAEVAVEVDPRTVTAEHAAAFVRSGINRASLGVQDFDANVQNAINRIQPYELTKKAADTLRGAGVKAINLDLMYGLPGQSEDTCRTSAQQALTLDPDRLAIFGYAHVPWMKKHQRLIDENALPDGPSRWRQFGAILDTLVGAGYQPIGLDHFAKPDDRLAVAQREGRLRRNFQGYTTDGSDALIGFGISSIGALPQGYVQNTVAHPEYQAAIEAGRPGVIKGCAIDDDDLLRRDLIERLMCDLAVDLEAVAARHGTTVEVFKEAVSRLDELVADGIAKIEGHKVTVLEDARPLVRTVAAVFDAHLARNQSTAPRHSKAI